MNHSAVIECLKDDLSNTNHRRISRIIEAMLAISGRITMQGISRWTEKGGSYRTIQRFFNQPLPWPKLQWQLLRHHLINQQDTYLLAADEVIVSKAGKHTHGLDRFFCSLAGRAIPSLCFFSIALISINKRTAYPLLSEQVIRSQQQKQATKANKGKNKATKEPKKAKVSSNPVPKRGRPKGSKNKDKVNVELSSHLRFVQTLLTRVLRLLRPSLQLRYLLIDGAYGYNEVMQLARQLELALISKLKSNAALYLPYLGEQKPRGANRKYGQKLDSQRIPRQYLVESCVKDNLLTETYQLTLLSKSFAQPLNVVIIQKTKLDSGARAQVLLFSADPELGWEKLIDYYSLRFQIEFVFRDAKQHWGLEDFMNQKQTPVMNAANLSLLLVSISKIMIDQRKRVQPEVSVLDLKAHFRAQKYALETLKLLPEKPDAIVIQQILDDIPRIGAIRAA